MSEERYHIMDGVYETGVRNAGLVLLTAAAAGGNLTRHALVVYACHICLLPFHWCKYSSLVEVIALSLRMLLYGDWSFLLFSLLD